MHGNTDVFKFREGLGRGWAQSIYTLTYIFSHIYSPCLYFTRVCKVDHVLPRRGPGRIETSACLSVFWLVCLEHQNVGPLALTSLPIWIAMPSRSQNALPPSKVFHGIFFNQCGCASHWRDEKVENVIQMQIYIRAYMYICTFSISIQKAMVGTE